MTEPTLTIREAACGAVCDSKQLAWRLGLTRFGVLIRRAGPGGFPSGTEWPSAECQAAQLEQFCWLVPLLELLNYVG
jgi:hypothetical protein